MAVYNAANTRITTTVHRANNLHDSETLTVVVAFGYLLVVHNEYCRGYKQAAEKYSEEQQPSVSREKIDPRGFRAFDYIIAMEEQLK